MPGATILTRDIHAMKIEDDSVIAHASRTAAELTARVHRDLEEAGLPLQFQSGLTAAAILAAAIMKTNAHHFVEETKAS